MIRPEFLSAKEVSILFGVHVNTIRRAIRLNFIPAIRVGNGDRSAFRISRKVLEGIHVGQLLEFSKKPAGNHSHRP